MCKKKKDGKLHELIEMRQLKIKYLEGIKGKKCLVHDVEPLKIYCGLWSAELVSRLRKTCLITPFLPSELN